MNIQQLENVLADINDFKSKNYQGIEDFIRKYDLSTPEKVIDFQVQLGNYVNKYIKRRISMCFLEMYPFTSEDLQKARYANPELQVINKLRIIERYREKNAETKEFAKNKMKPISMDEIKFFLENDGKISDEEIAKGLKRTLSTVLYLRKHCRSALRK